MAVEMSASRLLAPYFGDSLFIWANLIGLILIYLSGGYWIGGRIADRWPQARLLYALTLSASAANAIVPFVAKPIMGVAIRGVEQVSAGAFLGSFGVTVLLFSLPVTILGTVAPFAIRLSMRKVESAGNISGGLYALSTIGSILGTFLPVFLLIPWIGTRDTMLAFAAVLAGISAVGLGAGAPLLILAALALPQGAIKPSAASIYETESPYHFIQVVQQPDGSRELMLNEGWAVHSIYKPGQIMTGGYWDYFSLAPWFGGSQTPRRALCIGSAAGTVPGQLIHFYPDIHVDGIEIDPKVVDIGRRLFGMNEANLTVYIGDGRPFLMTTKNHYDLIAIDAFRQPYIPFYLTTREFFQAASGHLTPHGDCRHHEG